SLAGDLLAHWHEAGLDRVPGPDGLRRVQARGACPRADYSALPHREAPPLGYFAETPRDANQ
ncbi:MAG TPA: hypothetical protein VFW15_06505, partial [Thermoanaerobaculia bacterium]|nr:hypothetical protein [Thermoanaerobaculia bacterium]